jgi:hypothetical protein
MAMSSFCAVFAFFLCCAVLRSASSMRHCFLEDAAKHIGDVHSHSSLSTHQKERMNKTVFRNLSLN